MLLVVLREGGRDEGLRTKYRQSLCMGISPSGLGLRLMSLRYLPADFAALAGLRKPFVSAAPVAIGSGGCFRLDAPARACPFSSPRLASSSFDNPLVLLRNTFASVSRSRVLDLERSCASGLAPGAVFGIDAEEVFDVLLEVVVFRCGSGDGDMTRGVAGMDEAAILDAAEEVEDLTERPRGGCAEKADDTA